jgi:hypothetical protein
MHYCARGMDLVNTAPATLDVKRAGIVAIPQTPYVTNIQHLESNRRQHELAYQVYTLS